jgi:hypothetical protein
MTSSVESLCFSKMEEIRSGVSVTTPNELSVSVDEVFSQFSRVQLREAVGPDNIPNKLLK